MKACTTDSVRGRWILVATILASGMAFLDGTVVMVALPKLQAYFNADLMSLQWIVDSYALTLAALLLTAGSLGDIYGHRRIFAIGITAFVLFSIVCGFAATTEQLIYARGLQGVGGALMIPGSLAIINASFAVNNRGRAIGLWAGFSGGIAALGPFIGGWLTETLSWRYIFFINLPIGIFALFATLKFIPRFERQKDRGIDWLGTLLIIISLSTFAFGLIEGPRYGWTSRLILSCLAIAPLSFLLFIWVETQARHPMVSFKIFHDRNVIGANLITFFLYFALNGLIFFAVLNFQQLQSYSPIKAGLALLPPILIITFLSGAGGTLADKYGPRWPLTIGALFVMTSLLLLLIPDTDTSYWVDFFPGLVLFGFGMVLVIAPVTKTALAVPEGLSGAASGINNAVSRVSALMAVALLGAIAVSIFSQHLSSAIGSADIITNKEVILSQANKLAGIHVPLSFSSEAQEETHAIITTAFIFSYRFVLACCALFSFISACIAFLFIRD